MGFLGKQAGKTRLGLGFGRQEAEQASEDMAFFLLNVANLRKRARLARQREVALVRKRESLKFQFCQS